MKGNPSRGRLWRALGPVNGDAKRQALETGGAVACFRLRWVMAVGVADES